MKTKLRLIFTILATVVLMMSIITAAMLIPASDKAKKPVVIPAYAVEVAPGVFYLGKALDKGRVVEGYAMFVKPPCNNDGICDPEENPSCADCKTREDPVEPDTSSCYEFLAKGAKWRTVEPYIVNPSNTRGLDDAFVRDNLAFDIAKWETEAGVDILGDEIEGIVDGADLESPDNQNEVYFADIDPNEVIAVAIIWGYFSGPPFARELVEWDMVFNEADFNWGIGEAEKMDFENIATHELGHAVGLGDLYNSECSEQTMYGYASYGETKKRSLESGDIAGIQKLYSV